MAGKVTEGTNLKILKNRKKRGLLENLILAKLETDAFIKKEMGVKEETIVTQAMILESTLIRDAFVNFLTNEDLTWTISELKASLELEELSTIAPLNTQVATQVNTTVNTATTAPAGVATAGSSYSGGPTVGATVTATIGTGKGAGVGSGKGFVTEPLDMRKDGGRHGGRLKAIGHAYVGDPDIVPGSDTTDKQNDFTKVKLFYDKIPRDIL